MAELAALAGVAAAAGGYGAAGTAATAGLGTAVTAATTVASLAGTGLTAAGALRQGQNQREIAEFNARELERGADQERSLGFRKAQERRLQAQRVLSEQRAKASMSGAGTTEGEGYLDLVGDTAERGQYFSELEIGTAEDRARGIEGKAAASRWQGEMAEDVGYVKAAGSVIDGFNTALKDDELLGYFGVPKRGKRSNLRYDPERV